MKKIVTVIVAAVTISASAQTTGELLQFSQSNYGISTARSAAMGGAYTSLGADAASMSINPAGLAMYKSSEVSISPGIRLGSTTTGYTGSLLEQKNNTSKFVIGSLAGIYNSGNMTFGVGYNRLADYDSKSLSYGSSQQRSITDMFGMQVTGIDSKYLGIPENDIYRVFYDYPPVLWGAILGYQTGAIANSSSAKNYGSTLAAGALVSPSLARTIEGSLDEVTFSGAYNHDDKFYFGLTIGVQNLSYSKFDSYSELAEDTGTPTLDEVIHNRELHLNGSGVNFKFGVTVRPVEWFRVGVSYHSPTWTAINEEASENMTSYFFDEPNKGYFSDTPLYTSSYNVHSPSRLLGGLSFTVARRAIFSFDYKRTWYNGMRFENSFHEGGYRPEVTATAVDNYNAIADNMSSDGMINLNSIVKSQYGATNTMNVGAEWNVVGGMFLRAGYLYQDSPYKDSSLKDFGKLSQISAGLGFRNRNMSFDIAYVNSQTKQLPYQYYAYQDYAPEGAVTTKNVVDNIILTIGFRF